jgi:hypothetical protein
MRYARPANTRPFWPTVYAVAREYECATVGVKRSASNIARPNDLDNRPGDHRDLALAFIIVKLRILAGESVSRLGDMKKDTPMQP